MKRLGSIALATLVGALGSLVGGLGCENPSRLDSTTRNTRSPEPAAAKADHSGTVEERIARLEDKFAQYGEAFDFLAKVYSNQKQQQEQQERSVPAPDAVFAVDITSNVKLGLVEGSPEALVTIVEAWDFA